MKTFVKFIVLLALVSQSYAQAVVPENVRATNTLEKLQDLDRMGNADMLYGIPLPEGKVIGDTYMDKHWKKSAILLYENNKMIEGFLARYDIYLDELEIKARNGIKVLKGNKIKSFVWLDSINAVPAYFVNAKDFKSEDDVAFTGFFQVLSEGSVPLLKRTTLGIKKADYNIQFNVGSHDDKILKKDDFFMLKEDKVIELPSSKKKLLALFAEKEEDVERFMKDNDLGTNKEEQLKLIFDHYNSLVNNQQ
jgi:hypothetical protein